MTIFFFVLKRNVRNLSNLLFLTVFPIAAIFLPNPPEGWMWFPVGYQYFGILILFVGIRLTSLMVEDRQKGVIKRLAVAPVSHFQYLWQNLLAYSLILVLQCIIVVAGGYLYGHELYQPMYVLVLFILFSFVSLSMALAWNSLYRSKESAFLVYMAAVMLMSLLGGLIVPVEMLPTFLQRLSMLLPVHWLAEGLGWIAIGDESISHFLFIGGIMVLYTFLFLVIGSMRRIH
ncbi:ABC transporter permease [Halalkalibacter sp. AB-rgal2]|uniref:ABC transporter permease n=1 Tax=Halalkalibacter sp. AB-rgal2 TaxID=3242695 RepID=UPI00359E6071